MAFNPRNSLNAAAMFRALADVADQHPCSCLELRGHPDYDLLQSFGRADCPVPTGMDFQAEFRLLADELTLRVALGAAYQRYSGHPAPFLTGPELNVVDREMEATR
jgi:hypothetical protein